MKQKNKEQTSKDKNTEIGRERTDVGEGMRENREQGRGKIVDSIMCYVGDVVDG